MSQSLPIPLPDLFYTDLNSVRVSVYAEVTGKFPWRDGWRIEGDIYGPQCELSDTLPARIKLQDQGEGNTLLAAATVPDPCPWSAELPATYSVTTRLTKNAQSIQTEQQILAFKTLDTQGSVLVRTDLNGFTRRWVLRASTGSISSALNDGGDECRSLRLSRLVTNPTLADCQNATRHGLWIVAVLPQTDQPEATLEQQLASLSAWPCVACCILPNHLDLTGIHLPANLLLAASISADSSQDIPAWAQLLTVSMNNPSVFNSRWSSSTIPVIAHQVTSYNNDRMAREKCAVLQASLAPCTNYAGYLVSDAPLCPPHG